MSFDEIELPLRVGFGSKGGPNFSTEIIVIDSGYERRNQNWGAGAPRVRCKNRGALGIGRRDASELLPRAGRTRARLSPQGLERLFERRR